MRGLMRVATTMDRAARNSDLVAPFFPLVRSPLMHCTSQRSRSRTPTRTLDLLIPNLRPRALLPLALLSLQTLLPFRHQPTPPHPSLGPRPTPHPSQMLPPWRWTLHPFPPSPPWTVSSMASPPPPPIPSSPPRSIAHSLMPSIHKASSSPREHAPRPPLAPGRHPSQPFHQPCRLAWALPLHPPPSALARTTAALPNRIGHLQKDVAQVAHPPRSSVNNPGINLVAIAEAAAPLPHQLPHPAALIPHQAAATRSGTSGRTSGRTSMTMGAEMPKPLRHRANKPGLPCLHLLFFLFLLFLATPPVVPFYYLGSILASECVVDTSVHYAIAVARTISSPSWS
jgi:hypothetical protein